VNGFVDGLLGAAGAFNGVLWGPWTMGFFASVAVYLTVRSGFFQVRRFAFIHRRTFGALFERKARDDRKLTPLQAVSTSLAGAVGMGNIAGVATALSVGGPGALFWMWVLAVFGMMAKTAEITLGVHYREVDEEGEARGGPMHYIRKGLGWPKLAAFYSVGILVACALSTTLLQSHTVGRAFLGSYGVNPYLTTTAMAAVTGVVVIGGAKRVGSFCMRLVPAMSVVYVVGGIGVILFNLGRLDEAFALVARHAFSPAPAAGGFAGASVAAAMQFGMARGMFSNEAGQGTAGMAHATADTDHPFEEGLWGGFEVFVDTLLLCSITGLAVLTTGALQGGETGVELVIEGFGRGTTPVLGAAVVSFAIATFCLSTQIGFFVYYETAVTDLFGKGAMGVAKWLYLVPGVLFAGVARVDELWVFADISIGLSALPNLIALLALSGAFFELMRDYTGGERRWCTERSDRVGTYVRGPRGRGG